MQIRLHQRPFRRTSSSTARERVTVTTATDRASPSSWRYHPPTLQQATNNFLPAFSATLSFSRRKSPVFHCSLSLVQELICPHRKCPPQTGFPVLHRGAFSRSHSRFLSQSLRNPKLIHKTRMTQRTRANVSQRTTVPTRTHVTSSLLFVL